VLFSALLGAFAYDLSLATYVIPVPSRNAMQWVQANTPPGARFVVLTGRPDPFSDPTTEWFPLMTQRTSVNTVQGQEWTLGADFMPFLNDLGTLESCLNQGPDCLDKWSDAHRAAFDYVFIEKPQQDNASGASMLLAYQLRQDSQYALAFENAGVIVFARR
jgi:hypothetical protein